MSKPSLAEGFKFWFDEVRDLEHPEKMVAYIPVLALAGVYISLGDHEELTSYNWRQAVLQNNDAKSGLRLSLQSFHKDRVDDDFPISISYYAPDVDAAAQHKCAHESLLDGLPEGVDEIPDNEYFLGQTLGYARHDHGVMLDPLRLIDGGQQAFKNNYPRTLEFLMEHA